MVSAPLCLWRLVIIVLAFSDERGGAEGTVEQLVAGRALERSPEIRAARTATRPAAGSITQAGRRPNPTLSGSQMLMTGAQHQTLLEVEWPLDLFRREARVGTGAAPPSKRRRWAFKIASAFSPPPFDRQAGAACWPLGGTSTS